MTRLFYRVGNEEITSYSQAVARSKSLGVPLVACYEPIVEKTKVDPEARARRVAAIRAKAQARA